MERILLLNAFQSVPSLFHQRSKAFQTTKITLLICPKGVPSLFHQRSKGFIMTISLHKFCTDNSLSKSTVHRRCQELNIDTSNGLDQDAVTRLLSEFSVQPEQPQETDSPETSALTISTGNHRGVLDLPALPTDIDLSDTRGNAPLASFEAEDIDRFLDACDGFVAATDADYQNQLEITRKKEAAALKVKAKAEEVKTASLRYQLRSESLSIHNRNLDTELQTAMEELQGKPTQAAGGAGG